jgi:hypothetical protein
MLPPAQSALTHDHAVPMLRRLRLERLQIADIAATRAQDAVDLGGGNQRLHLRQREYGPGHTNGSVIKLHRERFTIEQRQG